MKVLVVGGPPVYSFSLCEELSKMGIEVTLLTDAHEELRRFQQSCNFLKIPRVLEKDDFYFAKVHKLYEYIKLYKPDIIHFQWTFNPRIDWIFSYFLRLQGKFKVVYTVHNILPHERAIGEKFALRVIYGNMRKLWVHAFENKSRLINEFGIKESKIYVIPHGNFSFYKRHFPDVPPKKAREILGINEDERIVLFFGSIRKYKGLEYLIRAFPAVASSIKNCRLIIAGEPLYGEFLYQRLIDKLGIREKVILCFKFIPMREISVFFNASDVVVLPYIECTQSGLVQLALSFGKPVVATRIGGLPEVVEEGKNGYLVPPGDEFELGKAIVKLLSNNEALNEMSRYALYLSETKYSWSKIAKEAIKLYES